MGAALEKAKRQKTKNYEWAAKGDHTSKEGLQHEKQWLKLTKSKNELDEVEIIQGAEKHLKIILGSSHHGSVVNESD